MMMAETLQNYDCILRVSCAKIVSGRHRRSGANLHRNLMVLAVIGRVQVAKNKLEAMQAQATYLMMDTEDDGAPAPLNPVPSPPKAVKELVQVSSGVQDEEEDEEDDEDEDDEEDINPPLEFSVLDSSSDLAEPVFVEEVAFASEAVEDLPESLRERKRKSDIRQPPIPRSKSQRVSGERCVPTSTR